MVVEPQALSVNSHEERQAFLYGDCWVLALALHRMFGFTPVFAVYWPEGEPGSPLDEWHWDHVFVETHAGDPLDIEGWPNLSKWRAAPDGFIRGFHFARDWGELHPLIQELVNSRGIPLESERHYDVEVLPAVVHLALRCPWAFRRMPLSTLADLPPRLGEF